MAAISQIAVELLRRRGGFRGAVKLAGGYTNRVWRAVRNDGSTVIVKQYRAPWTRANEERAIQCLGPLGMAPDRIEARSGTVLIWPDDEIVPIHTIDEWMCRDVGQALAKIHRLPSDRLEHGIRLATPRTERSEWRTINRIGARAAKDIGYDVPAAAIVHGDPCLENVFQHPNRRFARFGDFEEFGLGDPMADLVVCLVEAGCSAPDRAERAINWILAGYFGPADPRSEWHALFMRADVRLSLAKAALDELSGWASSNRETDLVARYAMGRQATLRALETVHAPI